jgi:transposase
MERVHAGVDVSAATLEVAWRGARDDRLNRATFPNDAGGHRSLIRLVTTGCRSARVALEATGIYGLDLALALEGARNVEVMVANPRTVADFGRAMLQRSKTDRIDAVTILTFVERMPFTPWLAPSRAALELRAISRRIAALGQMIRSEKNRHHAATSCEAIAELLAQSTLRTIEMLEREIATLRSAAQRVVSDDPILSRRQQLLTTIKGVGQNSSLQILAELFLLPADMSDKQWVAHAGLDPRLVQSGTSVHYAAHISKAGNHYLRAALYLPAVTASRYEPAVIAFRTHLASRNKRPKQIHVAVMRKLLHAIHAMFRDDTAFDGRKFFAAAAAEGTSGIAPSAISEVSSATLA